MSKRGGAWRFRGDFMGMSWGSLIQWEKNGDFYGKNGDFYGKNGDFYRKKCDLMGFSGDFMGFHAIERNLAKKTWD